MFEVDEESSVTGTTTEGQATTSQGEGIDLGDHLELVAKGADEEEEEPIFVERGDISAGAFVGVASAWPIDLGGRVEHQPSLEDFAVAFALLEGGAFEREALEGFDLGKEWTGEERVERGLEGGRFFGYRAFGLPESSAEDFFAEIAEVLEGKLEKAVGRGIKGIEAAFFAEIFGDESLVGVVPSAPVAEGVAEKERRVGIAGGFPILLGLEAGV